MAERPKALSWKGSELKSSEGSNPSPSAIYSVKDGQTWFFYTKSGTGIGQVFIVLKDIGR